MSTFRIQEFAKLASVTVRSLHHYDRLAEGRALVARRIRLGDEFTL